MALNDIAAVARNDEGSGAALGVLKQLFGEQLFHRPGYPDQRLSIPRGDSRPH